MCRCSERLKVYSGGESVTHTSTLGGSVEWDTIPKEMEVYKRRDGCELEG